MLLFSTMLDIVPDMTKERFIELVIEWNKTNKFKENIIPGVEWNGEKSIRFGTDKLWLEIIDYDDKGIVAVRYEKIQDDEVVWDTDYIMNFIEHKMAIQLERSYVAETVITNACFSTPHFISILSNAGALADDGILPVNNKPFKLDKSNLGILTDIITRKTTYNMPVIYVSKTRKMQDYPLDAGLLASRLKGVAHVLIESDNINDDLKEICGDHCDYSGDIGIYFTSGGEYLHKIRRFKKGESRKKESLEMIIDLLIKRVSIKQLDRMYTWQGVNNALLKELLDAQIKRREAAENETNDVYATFDQDFAELNSKIEALTKENEKLSADAYMMSTKLAQNNEVSVIVEGSEHDLYVGEIKDIILSVLSDTLVNTKPGTRRYDVLLDILEKNEYLKLGKARKEKVKKILNGYKIISTTMKKDLEDLGFTLTGDGKHYKALYCGDLRYQITLAKTPSDNRTGMNIAHTIGETVY